ncbi:MAG: hypothetical protein NTX91_02340 [candidate division SR1 bacterium]|nr:hypothetical protein [candidate division SR1 bacterium]
MKFTNMQSATNYVYAKLKEINPTVEKEDVYDTIMEEVMESVEYELTEEDTRFLEENQEDAQVIDTYLQNKLDDYEELLSEIVTDMVEETNEE